MDGESYAIGQALVGNTTPVGALECTVLSPTLKVKGTCIVAFTGADMRPTINNVEVPRYIPFVCHNGDVISGSFSQCGCACVISFAGGIDVPQKSTVACRHIQKANIGGFEGRPLVEGDEVRLKDCMRDTIICDYTRESNHLFNTVLFNRGGRECHEPLRVVLGSQAKHFTETGIRNFSSELYTLTIQCDRMGFRLDGSPC